MKIQNYLAGALLPALLLTSCLSNDDNSNNEATYTYGGETCFNYVYDNETEEVNLFDGPNFSMLYNFTDATVAVDITGLTVSNELPKTSFKLPTLSYTIDVQAGMYVTRANNVVPVNAAFNNYEFNTFTLRSNPVRGIVVNSQVGLFPIYLPSFELNGRYQVTVFPVQSVYLGVTNSIPKDTEDATTYTTKTNLFSVTIYHKTKTASIAFIDSNFAEGMPLQSFEIKNLPVTLDETGYIISTEAGVKYPLYTASNKEQANCYASNIKASSTLASGLTVINFDLDLSGLTGNVYTYGEYSVRNSLNYFGSSEE